jgi:hypothetical protein
MALAPELEPIYPRPELSFDFGSDDGVHPEARNPKTPVDAGDA